MGPHRQLQFASFEAFAALDREAREAADAFYAAPRALAESGEERFAELEARCAAAHDASLLLVLAKRRVGEVIGALERAALN